MKIKILALSLLAAISVHAEEITEYYYGYPTDKIKSYTVYEEGELGNLFVKLCFAPDGSLTSSKTANYKLTFVNQKLVSSEKDTRKMTFTKLFNIIVPVRYVDKSKDIDLAYTIDAESNVIKVEGTFKGGPFKQIHAIEGDMPTNLGTPEITKFYFNSLTEVGEMLFAAHIATEQSLTTH